jgi:NAD(P)-dependent dehydrogenase (short-subunit alcohol dehydrogenase family)
MAENASQSFRFSSSPKPARVLVVGASRGIGLALARQLDASPDVESVLAAARRPRDLQPPPAAGSRIIPVRIDVEEEASIEAAAREIAGLVSGLDLIINCAGLLHDGPRLQPERRLVHVESANLERLFRVHAVGPLLLAKHLQSLLPRRERGVFASLSARVGSIGDNHLGGWYAYRVSKAAHNMAIKNISIELSRRARGIVCVALHPGTVETDLSQPFVANVRREKLFSPARAARQLLQVIDSRTAEHNGGFFAWDGSEIPW